MRQGIKVVAAVLMLSAAASGFGADPRALPRERPAYRDGELLVAFAPAITKTARSATRNALGARVLRQFKGLGVEHWRLGSGVSVTAAVQALSAGGQVIFAEPNYLRYPTRVPDDPQFPQQWSLRNTGQTINVPGAALSGVPGADMNLVSAWDITTGAQSVVVAVADDGFDLAHADLASSIWTNPGEIPGDGIDNDGNGYVDDVHGWDILNDDNDPAPDLVTEEHGTAVVGCLGAAGSNGEGISGVAWQVSIMPLKFGFDVAGELAAMEYAVTNGARIFNASWGGPQFSQAESGGVDLLRQAGVLLVAAAGNDQGNNDRVPDYPSGLDSPNIVAVAASGPDDTLTPFTHYGQTSVDLAAPGVGVLTTTAGLVSTLTGTGPYQYLDGTSFSAPHVAGVAALLLAAYPQAGYQELKGRLLAGVRPLADALGRLAAGGRVDALQSLSAGPGTVVVPGAVSVDDQAGSVPNAVLDPGESATLAVRLDAYWQPAAATTAHLASGDGTLSVSQGDASYGDIVPGGGVSRSYGISLAADGGCHRRLPLELNISAAGGYGVSRDLMLEVGALRNGVSCDSVLQTDRFDDFHYYHVDVPTNAGTLSITTTAQRDVDLLVRYGEPPRFDFATYPLPSGRDSQTLVSAGLTGNERIDIASPSVGTYHVVVINFSQQPQTAYTVRADFGGPGQIALAAAQLSVGEADGNTVLSVTRSRGSLGAVSVDYATTGGSATAGSDYRPVSGTLSWAAGDSAPRQITLQVLDDTAAESAETIELGLSSPTGGATLGSPATAQVTIVDNDSAPVSSGGGGSGALDPLGLLLLLPPLSWRSRHR